MTAQLPRRFIWATRGKSWGFRFLRDGGFDDPLSVYETAVAPLGDRPNALWRADDHVAVRFSDPESRRDSAGRVIPHEFVLFDDIASSATSFEQTRDQVWELVSGEYDTIWDLPAASANQ